MWDKDQKNDSMKLCGKRNLAKTTVSSPMALWKWSQFWLFLVWQQYVQKHKQTHISTIFCTTLYIAS